MMFWLSVYAFAITLNWLWQLFRRAADRRRCTEFRNMERDRVERAHARLRDVEPREAAFRQALAYYADSDNWRGSGAAHSPAFKDRGKRAREVLDARQPVEVVFHPTNVQWANLAKEGEL